MKRKDLDLKLVELARVKRPPPKRSAVFHVKRRVRSMRGK